MEYPQNVGIKAMEIYVPAQCLDQTLFEKHEGASAGKFTIGLGLTSMNYCTDREDVCSLALTAVSSLLRKYNIDPNSIGRLEVGTESMVDKAKSVKTVLTQLFEPHGNTSMEGVDTMNACYGGTNALFNAVNWVESRSWDGRDAMVVASDIALYNQPASRPTGGAGCVAMLVGPNAVLSLEPSLRGTYMTHSFDFYKPNLKSEYPLVNGHESVRCYLSAVDNCHKNLLQRREKFKNRSNGHSVDHDEKGGVLDLFDYMAFHTPNCKLVSKSYGRLMYNDALRSQDEAVWKMVSEDLRSLSYQESLHSKELERAFIGLSKEQYLSRVEPSIRAPTLCGNMYTASVYCSLISLVSHIDAKEAVGKTIGVYSFGSGLASTLFGLKVTGDLTEIVKKADIMNRLKGRHVATPEEYEEACALRELAYGAKNYKPTGDISRLVPGTYYLDNIDEEFRRTYAIKK
ncbi:hydroxymethylglutaryl-CoA synthase [Pochonia chlamydosporia 170]|uniref:Hydroxymethylglutaryl-CoA synthase n=1 Tax=Pochonia chlamydosporia 170 TaxID=1380566 RepID=A0A179G1U2_METCM|nr:hydroxymethylglutaryl-CoA synthase [Pochonia chlamydosporia 170]OAQ71311.1 hydroxymethylglutaryl-CoA synthase [Pochonia chlamydosporia 170]